LKKDKRFSHKEAQRSQRKKIKKEFLSADLRRLKKDKRFSHKEAQRSQRKKIKKEFLSAE